MLIQKLDNRRGSAEERRYYKWLEGFPCCLSARPDGVQRAHVGDHQQGKGMARKAALWTVLPLQIALHHAEEQNREGFWLDAIGESPVPWAERLHDCFGKDDRLAAADLLCDMHDLAMQHGRHFLISILRRAA